MNVVKQNLTSRSLVVAIALVSVSLISACSDSSSPTGGGGGNTPPASLTWDDFAGPLLAANCGSSSCHGATPGQSGFSVLSYSSAISGGSNSAGNGIVANDTAASVVYQKLLTTPPFGGRMPQGGPFFAQSTLDSIAMWIMAGAPQSP